ncbi:PRC-barrel domain-containing protein [Hyphococcus sp.]|uniref:PRC-barrel domain-containing protein n=1 Tax=Hyphococcus sp. TaxID=2038636 RepID=UPI003CCBAB3C
MRKSIITASIASLAFGFGAANAQDAAETPSYANEPASVEAEASATQSAELEGQNVFDANGQPVGTVEAIEVAADGSEDAILSVGGFLGLGAKKISVGVEELEANADGSGYTISMTAEDVEAAPAYEGAASMDEPVNEQ